MNFRNTMIGMVAIVSLVACSKSEEKKTGAAAQGAPAVVDDGRIAGTYEAGTPNFIFGASGSQVSVDGQVVQHVNDATFTGFPMLSSQVSDLSSITKVINTKENALELWAGESLLLAFDLRSSTPALLHSGKGGFQAEHVIFAMSEADKGQKQGMSTATLTIDMRECMAEQKQEEQKPVDQGKQGQEPFDQSKKPLDQGKHQFSAVAAVEGEDLGGQGQAEGQGQAKEQEKPMEQGKPTEICKLVSMVWQLAEIEQPKQQDQGKAPIDQGKEPVDQGKVTPIDQGKQSQDQGKVTPIDQGKATPEPVDQGKQGQDQGKVTPIDQGKATPEPVDQGKATPEPVDQGKATPEPVDQGKVAPIDQAKEQGKEPAPIEQGKEQGHDQAKK